MEKSRVSWLKLDDSFPEHAKVAELSDKAFRVHVGALCYSARNLTDGHIPAAISKTLTLGRAKLSTELVTAGLWDTNGGGGYVIHDYLDYNPSREQVETERQRRAEAGKKGADQRWHKP